MLLREMINTPEVTDEEDDPLAVKNKVDPAVAALPYFEYQKRIRKLKKHGVGTEVLDGVERHLRKKILSLRKQQRGQLSSAPYPHVFQVNTAVKVTNPYFDDAAVARYAGTLDGYDVFNKKKTSSVKFFKQHIDEVNIALKNNGLAPIDTLYCSLTRNNALTFLATNKTNNVWFSNTHGFTMAQAIVGLDVDPSDITDPIDHDRHRAWWDPKSTPRWTWWRHEGLYVNGCNIFSESGKDTPKDAKELNTRIKKALAYVAP